MEIKDLVNNHGIIGVVSSYQHKLNLNDTVLELNINNLENNLKEVGLSNNIINTKLKDLSMNDLTKLDLASKLNKDIIIIGNLSNTLNSKELDTIKKLLIKLNKEDNKKIVVIDNNINTFFNLTKKIIVMQNKSILYETEDYYDDNLYKYVKCPKIIEFIKYVNKNGKKLENNIEIYELIKDIYRSVS